MADKPVTATVVETVTEAVKPEKMIHKFLDVAVGFISSLGSEAAGRMLFPDFKPADREMLEKLTGMVKEGKHDEAWEMLKPRLAGKGPEDESIFRSDLLSLYEMPPDVTTPWPTPAQLNNLAAQYAALPDDVRRRYRLSHTIETDIEVRRRNLIVMAMLPNNAAREAMIRAAGHYEETLLQQLRTRLGNLAQADNRRSDRRARVLRAAFRRPLGWRDLLRNFFNPFE